MGNQIRRHRAALDFPTEQAALKRLYRVTRSLDSTGRGQTRWTMRWKPAFKRIRHHLRRPLAGRRNLLDETLGNTLNETDPCRRCVSCGPCRTCSRRCCRCRCCGQDEHSRVGLRVAASLRTATRSSSTEPKSDQTQDVAVNGGGTTYHTPMVGPTKVRGSGWYKGDISGQIVGPPGIVTMGPSRAFSNQAWVNDPG